VSLEAVHAAIRQVAVEEYVEGRTIESLHRQWGIPRGTLADLMKRRGVHQPGRKAGAPLKETCHKGHSLAEHGKPATGGGRYCSECKRQRERVDG
jgi:hypothetical protein